MPDTVIDSFDHGRLWIRITAINMAKDDIVAKLGEVLDSNSNVFPFTGQTWSEYIREKVEDDQWKYIKTHLHGPSMKNVGTATNERPGEHLVLSARDFVLDFLDSEFSKDFDSLFD